MAIKNFKAPVHKEEKSMPDVILVSKYMKTQLITFKPRQSVLEVMETLIKHRISGGPVIGENNQLLGMISEGDCMKKISESRYYNMPMNDVTVDKLMATDLETILSSMTIFEAASLFYKSNRRRFPVLKDGKLVGQISRRDILKAALSLKDNW